MANPSNGEMIDMSTWRKNTLNVTYTLVSLTLRWGHSAVTFPINEVNSMLVFGGALYDGLDIDYSADILVLMRFVTNNYPEPPNLVWSQVEMTGDPTAGPLPRHYHAAAMYPYSSGANSPPRYMVILGGFSASKAVALEDMWLLDTTKCTWRTVSENCACDVSAWVQRLPIVGLPPKGVFGHRLFVTFKNSLVILGGDTSPNTAFSGGLGASGVLVTTSSENILGGGSLTFSSPPSLEGTPPKSLFRASVALLDTTYLENGRQELVCIGGQEGWDTLSPPSSFLAVLNDLDLTYASLSGEIPYILAGGTVAIFVLGILGVYAWRRHLKLKSSASLLSFPGSRYTYAEASARTRGGLVEERQQLLHQDIDADALLEDTKRFNYGALGPVSSETGDSGTPQRASSNLAANDNHKSDESANGKMSAGMAKSALRSGGASRKLSSRSRAGSRSDRAAEKSLVDLLSVENEDAGASEDVIRLF